MNVISFKEICRKACVGYKYIKLVFCLVLFVIVMLWCFSLQEDVHFFPEKREVFSLRICQNLSFNLG